MSTQHKLDWKSTWSTSSSIQTAQGYLQKSFKRMREWHPPHWRKRLTKSLNWMNNLCFGAWDAQLRLGSTSRGSEPLRLRLLGGTTETRWGKGSLLPNPLPRLGGQSCRTWKTKQCVYCTCGNWSSYSRDGGGTKNVLMSNLIERKGLCAALRRNLAAHSPQADGSMGMNGFLRVKDIL